MADSIGPHGIDRELFAQRLDGACRAAIGFARSMVRQELPDRFQVLLRRNSSYDGNPLESDQEIFPDESGLGIEGPMTAESAVTVLWRSGKIPEWINARAYDATDECSHVMLESCGRYTALRENLYHTAADHPPFNVTSPALPTRWQSVEADGRFDLEGQRE